MSLSGFSPTWVRHRTYKDVRIRSQVASHTDTPPLQVEDAVDALMREQFVAAHMHTAEHLDGFSLIDSNGKCGSNSAMKSTSPRASSAVEVRPASVST